MLVIYDRKTFIVQATGFILSAKVIHASLVKTRLPAFPAYLKLGHKAQLGQCLYLNCLRNE